MSILHRPLPIVEPEQHPPLAERSRHPEPPAASPRRGSPVATLFLLALVALLAGHFSRQYAQNETAQPSPFDWRADWIASPYKDVQTACFRKSFNLSGEVRYAYLVMDADSYYRLRINGKAPGPAFRPEAWASLPRSQTPYSQLGYARRNTIARIFNITPFLQQGRNVICVLVQNDQGMPRLLAQTRIETTGFQEIVTDSSWKCAPSEQKNYTISWMAPEYPDYAWPAAVPAGHAGAIPVDGDPSLYETPYVGAFIGGNSTAIGGVTRFRRTIVCPSSQRNGWLRVAANAPYDIYLNGLPINTNSMTHQYMQPLVVRGGGNSASNGDFFTLGRIQHSTPITEYSPGDFSPSISQTLLRGVFRPGKNQLEVVMHGSAVLTPRAQALFFLQGRLVFEDGSVQTLFTDGRWETISDGESIWRPARPGPALTSAFLSNANAYVRNSLDSAAGLSSYDMGFYRSDLAAALPFFAGLLLLPGAVSVLLRLLRLKLPGPWMATGLGLAGAPAVVLVAALTMQGIFFPSPQKYQLNSPAFAGDVLLAAALAGACGVVVIVGAALSVRNAGLSRSTSFIVNGLPVPSAAPPVVPARKSIRQLLSQYGYAVGLALVIGLASVVYIYHIGANDYLPDEYTSILAARGILQHGIPRYPSDIIYPRSVIFHYLLAMSMLLTHSTTNPLSTRLPAALWSLALLPLVYLFGRAVMGRAVGLTAAIVTAFSPFMIFYAREARFYSQFSFFATLMVYCLYQSVCQPEKPRYRAATVLAFIGSYLSQEFTLTLVIPTIIVILLARQLPLWLRWVTIRWVILALLCVLTELLVYARYGQTSLMSIDTETMLLMAFHTDNLDLVLSMLFIGNENSHLLIGLLYLLGLVWTVLRPFRRSGRPALPRGPVVWQWWNFLYLMTGITCFMTTLLTPRPATRYIIHMFPCVALTAVCVAFQFGASVRHWARRMLRYPLAARYVQAAFLICLTILAVAEYRPQRVWNTIYEGRRFNRGTTEASRYVEANWRPGDKIILFSPDIGTIHLNQADYFWRSVPNSIFIYRARDGRLRERDTGAVDIDSLDKLRRIVSDNSRVWLIIPRKNITGGSRYNNGALARFAKGNFQVRRETVGIEVLLWDRRLNHYQNSSPDEGSDDFYF